MAKFDTQHLDEQLLEAFENLLEDAPISDDEISAAFGEFVEA